MLCEQPDLIMLSMFILSAHVEILHSVAMKTVCSPVALRQASESVAEARSVAERVRR